MGIASLTLLGAKDLNDPATIDDGEYYVDNTASGLPKGQTAGYFKQLSYNDGTDDIFLVQEFKGLLRYGDTELATYERFYFPKEAALGLHAKALMWQKRRPLVYLDER